MGIALGRRSNLVGMDNDEVASLRRLLHYPLAMTRFIIDLQMIVNKINFLIGRLCIQISHNR